MIDTPDGLHGAHIQRQARIALGAYGLRAAIEMGQLVGFGRGVVLEAGRVLDLRTRSAGALLLAGPSGVLVGPTAAVLHGCTATGGFPVHVLVPHSRRIRSRAGMVVHQGHVNEADVVQLDGLRVLRLEIVIADLLRTAPRRTALACADQALKPLSVDARTRFRAEIARILAVQADRRGTRRGRQLLDLATGLPESPAESAVLLVVVDSGFPLPVCQYAVDDIGGGTRYRLDFAWPELKIALEYDGYEAHLGRAAADAAREADLRRRGWLVVRAVASDLRDPTDLVIRLRDAFQCRRFAA